MMQEGSRAGSARVRCNRRVWAPSLRAAPPLTALQAPHRRERRLLGIQVISNTRTRQLCHASKLRGWEENHHLHVHK